MEKGQLDRAINILSRPRVFIFTSLLIAVSTYLVWSDAYGIAGVITASGGVGILDVGGAFTPQEAYAHIASMGQGGREAYLSFHAGIDFVYPATYAIFGLSFLALVCQKMMVQHTKVQWLMLAPILSALCDYLENYFISQMLLSFPSHNAQHSILANFFHLGKPIFGLVAIATLILGVLYRFTHAKKTRN